MFKQNIGVLKEVRSYNHNVHYLKSVKNGEPFVSILKHFDNSKTALMQNELSIYKKTEEIRNTDKAKAIDFPIIYYIHKDTDLFCEFCGIDLGSFYMNKSYKAAKRDMLSDIILTMISLLSALSSLAMYHGDIRSENIMKNRGGSKLIDFEYSFINLIIND